jgi:hypothetical protein
MASLMLNHETVGFIKAMILILLIHSHCALAKGHEPEAEPEILHQRKHPGKSNQRRVPILPFDAFAVCSGIQIYYGARKLSHGPDKLA